MNNKEKTKILKIILSCKTEKQLINVQGWLYKIYMNKFKITRDLLLRDEWYYFNNKIESMKKEL